MHVPVLHLLHGFHGMRLDPALNKAGLQSSSTQGRERRGVFLINNFFFHNFRVYSVLFSWWSWAASSSQYCTLYHQFLLDLYSFRQMFSILVHINEKEVGLHCKTKDEWLVTQMKQEFLCKECSGQKVRMCIDQFLGGVSTLCFVNLPLHEVCI